MTTDPEYTGLSSEEMLEFSRPFDEEVPENRRLDFTWAFAPDDEAPRPAKPQDPAQAATGEPAPLFPDKPAKGAKSAKAEGGSTTAKHSPASTDEVLYGSAFAELLIEGQFDGQFARFNTDVAGTGLPWQKRKKSSAPMYFDQSSQALLAYLADTLQVTKGAVVQALLAWFGSFCMDDSHRLREELAEPRARQMLLGALEGQIPFPNQEIEDTLLISREQLRDEWICFWEYLWSPEFYAQNASYSTALQPQHNGWLKRLAKAKGKTPAELLGEIIEALAQRDLGVSLPDKSCPSDG